MAKWQRSKRVNKWSWTLHLSFPSLVTQELALISWQTVVCMLLYGAYVLFMLTKRKNNSMELIKSNDKKRVANARLQSVMGQSRRSKCR